MEFISGILPMLAMWLILGVMYFIKLVFDRQKYAKQSENHVLVITLPKAGKLRIKLVPISNKGGTAVVKVPDNRGKITEYSPVHILGEAGEFPVDFPIGKPKFVQTTVQGLIYYEGDTEPLSNTTDRPIVSAQLVANLIDGIATSAAEAMKKSMESSGDKLKKESSLAIIFIGLFVIIGLGIANVVMTYGALEILEAVKAFLGVTG